MAMTKRDHDYLAAEHRRCGTWEATLAAVRRKAEHRRQAAENARERAERPNADVAHQTERAENLAASAARHEKIAAYIEDQMNAEEENDG